MASKDASIVSPASDSPHLTVASVVSPTSPPEYSNLPEVFQPQQSSYPEVVTTGKEDPNFSPKVYLGTGLAPYPQTNSDISTPPPVPPKNDADGLETVEPKEPKKFWQRKLGWVLIGAAVLAIIALAVGLGVGLTRRDSGNSANNEANKGNNSNNNNTSADTGNNNNSTTDSTPAKADFCNGFCSQVLTTATFENKMHVFSRSKNDTLQYKVNDEGKWSDDWTELPEAPGKIISQPSAISWDIKGVVRLDVFATIEEDGGIVNIQRVNGTWGNWTTLNKGASSQPILCRTYGDRIDIFATEKTFSDIGHNWWISTQKQPDWYERSGGDLKRENLGRAESAPGVTCRGGDEIHDVAWYTEGKPEANFAQYESKSSKYINQQTFEGNWTGSPVLYSARGANGGYDDNPRTDFLGVMDNGTVFHFSWDSTNGLSGKPVPIGGAVASTPSVVSLTTGTLDAVAVGVNGNLTHNHYDGKAWAGEWDDLGVKAKSAPLIARYNDKVWVVVTGEDGQLYYGSLTINKLDSKWSKMTMQSLGGESTDGFYVRS